MQRGQMVRRTRILSHHHKELLLLLTALLFKTHSAHPVLRSCLSKPCHFHPPNLHAIDRPPTSSNEETDSWDYRTQRRQNKQPQSDEDWDSPPRESGENIVLGKDYYDLSAATEKRAMYEGAFEHFPSSQSPILLFFKTPICNPTVDLCHTTPVKKEHLFEAQERPREEYYKLPDKKTRLGMQNWSAAGLPFSVLYHKQVRAKGGNANGGESQNGAPAARKTAEGWASHRVNTRKQYSTLPHLFVSYGWGPLGK